VASHGGRYVVRGGDVQALEGEPPKGYIVVNRVRQCEESAGVVRLAGVLGDPFDPARRNQEAAYLSSRANPSSDGAPSSANLSWSHNDMNKQRILRSPVSIPARSSSWRIALVVLFASTFCGGIYAAGRIR